MLRDKAGAETKRVAIVPQQVYVAAPASLIFEMISAGGYVPRASTGRTMSRLAGNGTRQVLAFGTGNDQRQTTMKEVLASPPDRVTYRHLSGPFTGAREVILLSAASGGTTLLLSAEFEAISESARRLHKLAIEHAAHEHLLDLKMAAEERVRPIDLEVTLPSVLVAVPPLATEQELLEAIEGQEELEWGHAGHGRGVARVAASLAEAIMLPERQIEQLRRAALLHDAGKLAIDHSLWGTRGTLSPDQRLLMQAHPELGYDLAARAGLPEVVLTTIMHHHERWDGHGYPEGLQGEAIPLKARILFLAEAVDSMLRATYRRQTMSPETVAATLEAGAGRQWEPMLARRAARIIRGKAHGG